MWEPQYTVLHKRAKKINRTVHIDPKMTTKFIPIHGRIYFFKLHFVPTYYLYVYQVSQIFLGQFLGIYISRSLVAPTQSDGDICWWQGLALYGAYLFLKLP